MRWLWLIMGLVLAGLQYRIWLGDGSLAEIRYLERQITDQRDINAGLYDRNQQLIIEVKELQGGTEGIEEQAREELGMIAEGETFFLLIPKE